MQSVECSGIKRTLLNLQAAAVVAGCIWPLRKRVHSNEIILLYNFQFASSCFETSWKCLNVVIIENNGTAFKDFQQSKLLADPCKIFIG